MQAKPGHFHDLYPKGIKDESVILFPARNGLQREHLTPLLRPDGYPIADRATQYLSHRVFVALFQVQVTVFFISLNNPLTLQKIGYPVADRMYQFCQFLLIRCVGTMKSASTPGSGGVNAVHKQHVWSFSLDSIYSKLKNQESRSWQCRLCLGTVSGEVEMTTTQEIYTIVAGYRILESTANVDITGGARYTSIENKIDLSITPAVLPGGSVSADETIDWWDPVVGVRVEYPFADTWALVGYADYGGFHVGSDETYQALLGLDWNFHKNFSARAGYRYLYQDYKDDGEDIEWDMALQGLFLGLGIMF